MQLTNRAYVQPSFLGTHVIGMGTKREVVKQVLSISKFHQWSILQYNAINDTLKQHSEGHSHLLNISVRTSASTFASCNALGPVLPDPKKFMMLQRVVEGQLDTHPHGNHRDVT
jgi:hypothetical protein